MKTLKAEVYSALSNVNADVSQASNNVFSTFPAVTYRITQNRPEYDFDKSIGLQEVEVTVDIWSNSGTEAISLLDSVETEMRNIDLFLNFTADLPESDGLIHINTRFGGNK